MTSWKKSFLILCAALMAPVVAFAQAPAAATAPAAAASTAAPAAAASPASTRSVGDRNYTLGIGDVIEVTALGQSDFGATKSSISSDGTILLPFIGAVQAAGRSPGQLAEEVRVALERGGFFAQPLIRVDLITPASRFVTVLGSVGSPGLVSLDREYRLSEIVAKAGGRTGAGADYLLLTREGATEPQRYVLSDLATGTGQNDPVVQPKDKIYVPAAENEVFYLTGQVKSPGPYPVSRSMTVRMALARGGGVSEMGSEKKVKIIRDGKPVERVQLDQTMVQAGDIVQIGARLF